MAADYSPQRWIASCDEPEKLRNFLVNAESRGASDLCALARRRLLEILPKAEQGTIEHDVWRSIHALEEVRKQEAGKTIRLSRTRQAIDRKGVKQTVCDLVSKTNKSEGFTMLEDRSMLEYSFEAVVLRHTSEFDSSVTLAAQKRLEEAGWP